MPHNLEKRTQILILPRIFNKKSLTCISVKSTFCSQNEQKSYSHIVHNFQTRLHLSGYGVQAISQMTIHIPVLSKQVLHLLEPLPEKVFIDATIGLGGHSREILNSLNGKGWLYGVDVDQENLARAKENLKKFQNVTFIRDSFKNLQEIGERILKEQTKIDGILLDLGLSSVHVDEPQRGFSFKHSGPLDMRFDARERLTAADIVNRWSEKDLIAIFKHYGEEKFANRIAHEIVHIRKNENFTTTSQLADFVASIVPQKVGRKIHPATRVFQALRIAVNREVEVLEKGLAGAIKVLSHGGRIAVISYHSIEDRIVKNIFRTAKREGMMKILTKKPVTPDAEEIRENRRSRSAKLRAAERL